MLFILYSQEQAKIYRALNFKQMNPKMKKKAVIPPAKIIFFFRHLKKKI